jgi:hypothetical protein
MAATWRMVGKHFLWFQNKDLLQKPGKSGTTCLQHLDVAVKYQNSGVCFKTWIKKLMTLLMFAMSACLCCRCGLI